MKVLVAGSAYDDTPEPEKTKFIAACNAIGVALANSKHEIVIGSEQLHSADRRVLDGALSTGKELKVSLIRPVGDTPFINGLPPDRVSLARDTLRGDWSAGRVSQILAADAVLLIRGGRGTAAIGYTAPSLEKPVLALPFFGGGAADVQKEFRYEYQRLPYLKTHIDLDGQGWSDEQAPEVVRALEELVKRRAFKKSARMPMLLYMSLIATCLIAWVYVFAQPFQPRSYSFFLMLALAGLLGTMLRNNLRMMFDPTAVFAWESLFIETGAGLLLGFALALLYMVGALAITGTAEKVIQGGDEDFHRVSVVMTLLGLGAGLMIELAADRVRGWFTGHLELSGAADRH
jgi:hypothetical protein